MIFCILEIHYQRHQVKATNTFYLVTLSMYILRFVKWINVIEDYFGFEYGLTFILKVLCAQIKIINKANSESNL